MTTLYLLLAPILLFLIANVTLVTACMLSSDISRQEEKQLQTLAIQTNNQQISKRGGL